jgi:Phage tail lysozyme
MAGIPQNAKAIYDFLIKEGFSSNAAAGILGNIEQESGGNPTAGSNPPGAGLIQILGDPGGTLKAELQRTMAYIRANGSVADINAHSPNPGAAALWFSEKYERPGVPNNPNRVASAQLVARAAKTGKWPQSAGISGGGGGSEIPPALEVGGGLGLQGIGLGGLPQLGKDALSTITGTAATLGDIATAIQGITKDITTAMKFLAVLGHPSFWLRVGAFIGGVISLAIGLFFLSKSVGIDPPMPNVVPIPV